MGVVNEARLKEMLLNILFGPNSIMYFCAVALQPTGDQSKMNPAFVQP